MPYLLKDLIVNPLAFLGFSLTGIVSLWARGSHNWDLNEWNCPTRNRW